MIHMPQWVVFSFPYWASRGSADLTVKGHHRRSRMGQGPLRLTDFTGGSSASAGVASQVVGLGRGIDTCSTSVSNVPIIGYIFMKRRNVS